MTFETRAEAAAALKDGQLICATVLTSGKPVYFLTPIDATDTQVRDRAFEIRNGRKISATELTIDSFAKRRRLWR